MRVIQFHTLPRFHSIGEFLGLSKPTLSEDEFAVLLEENDERFDGILDVVEEIAAEQGLCKDEDSSIDYRMLATSDANYASTTSIGETLFEGKKSALVYVNAILPEPFAYFPGFPPMGLFVDTFITAGPKEAEVAATLEGTLRSWVYDNGEQYARAPPEARLRREALQRLGFLSNLERVGIASVRAYLLEKAKGSYADPEIISQYTQRWDELLEKHSEEGFLHFMLRSMLLDNSARMLIDIADATGKRIKKHYKK